MTHICVGNLSIIGPDNGLSPGRCQAIIWTNAGILLIGPWWTNFCEILITIQAFSFKKMDLKMSSVKRRPFCLGLNVLRMVEWAHRLQLWSTHHWPNNTTPCGRHFQVHFWINICILIKISLNYICKGPIVNNRQQTIISTNADQNDNIWGNKGACVNR